MHKLILLGLMLAIFAMPCLGQDTRVESQYGYAIKNPPGWTYVNGYYHPVIGTFNHMWRDTINNVTAAVDTMILPSGASRAFNLINNDATNTFEYWLDNDAVGSKHGFIKPGVSRYIPSAGSTLFVKQAVTVPDIEIEFGK